MKQKIILIACIILLSISNSLGQVWQKPINTGSQGNYVCFDNENNQYVTGEFAYNELDNMFQNINLLDSTNENFGYYFAKLDSNKEIQWLKVLESDWGFYNNKIKLDTNNDIVMVGNYMRGITIDSVKHFDGNDYEWRNFIAKFSTKGKLKWIKYFNSSIIEDLYIDSKSQIFITGHFQGSLYFGTQSSIYNETTTGYYAKFDSNGNFLNAESIGGNWQIESYAITADSLENVYIGGFMAGDAYFDTKHAYSKSTDQFIAKFDKNNNNIWVKHFGSTWNDRMECIYSLSLDNTGEYLYAAGVIQGGTVSYDNHSLSIDDKNIFLGKFTLDGNVSWVNNFGNWSGAASYTEEAKCVAVNGNGSVYLNGIFMGTANFGTYSIKSKGNSGGSSDIDLFVAKVDSDGKIAWVNRCGGIGEDRIYSLAIDNSGNPCIGGLITPFSDFGDYSLTGQYQFSGFYATITDTMETKDITTNIVINNEDNDIMVFPTVTKDYVYLKNIKGNEMITIYGSSGVIVSKTTIRDDRVDMSDLRNGVYFLSISQKEKKVVFKIIKN